MQSSVSISFQKLGFCASNAWFDQCFAWVQQQHPNHSRHQILDEIKKQWFVTDIREPGVQEKNQIQDAWLSARKIVIKQAFICLQILSALDIAKPAYAQLQDLLKVDNDNVAISSEVESNQFKAAWEPKGSRVMKLTLTDGFKEIQAMEHEFIPALKYPVKSGMKIKLIGPLVCRRGIILLTPKNIQILSDLVIEELEQEFNIKSILRDKVGTDNVGPVHQEPQQRIRQPLSQIPALSEDNFLEDDDDIFNHVELPGNQQRPPVRGASNGTSSHKSTKPFEFLKHVQKDDQVHVVKGCVVSLATKLEVSPSKTHWKLSVIITDGSETCQRDICPQLLQQWIGIAPGDYPELRGKEKEDVKKSVHNLSQKLSTFNGLIKLQKNQIIDLVPVNRGHLQQLKNRLK